MVSLQPPVCEFDIAMPDFCLPDTNGELWTPERATGENGLLVMFICNHCPYVKAILDRLIRDTAALRDLGLHSVAIMSNDPAEYAEDSLENMQRLAEEKQFPFPYLLDETQEVAKAFGAICTPDFFGYNAAHRLQYRGRLDASRKDPAPENARRDLFLAMTEVAETGRGPAEQFASMGCSIKWKEDHG